MLEITNHILYPNYLVYTCPKCYTNNMGNDISTECNKCKHIIKNIEKFQKMLIKRLHYYIKGDEGD